MKIGIYFVFNLKEIITQLSVKISKVIFYYLPAMRCDLIILNITAIILIYLREPNQKTGKKFGRSAH